LKSILIDIALLFPIFVFTMHICILNKRTTSEKSQSLLIQCWHFTSRLMKYLSSKFSRLYAGIGMSDCKYTALPIVLINHKESFIYYLSLSCHVYR
jgi:hypothetical protein